MQINQLTKIVRNKWLYYWQRLTPHLYVKNQIEKSRKFLDELPGKAPVEAVIEVGNKCNLNCLSCDLSKSTRPKGEIEPALFSKAVDMFVEMGFRELKLHMNNEPIFNKNIIDLLKITNQKGMTVHLSTNGMLIPSFIDKYISAGLDLSKLDFRYSIDGGTPETFERLRKGASFDKLIEGLEYLTEIYRKYNQVCELSVNYNLSMDTAKEVGEFVKRFGKYFGNDRFYKNYCFRLLDARNAAGEENKQWKSGHLGYPVYNCPCWIPMGCLFVLYDGRVSGCCYDYNGELIVGDITKKTIAEIWNDEPIKRLRDAHIKKDLKAYPKCMNCFWPKFELARSVDAYIRTVLLRKYLNDSDSFVQGLTSYIEAQSSGRE